MLVRVVLIGVLAIVCFHLAACAGAPPGFSTGTGGGSTMGSSPVYVTNINAASVSAYLINHTSGALQRVDSSPFATGRPSPDSLALDPAGRFLLVASSSSMSTSVFGVNTGTAALTPVPGSPFTTPANEVRIAVHPNGNLVYGLSNMPAQIDGYNFNAGTGSLSPLPGFPVSLSGSGAMGLAISPNGKFLYTSNPSTNLITSFTIASGGTLAPLATTTASRGPVYLTFDTSGSFLFAINLSGGPSGSGSVSVFTVSLAGALTEISGSPFAAGSAPVSATFSNGVLYVVNQGSANLSAFGLNNATGQLTQIKGSPYQVGTRPVSVAAAAHGTFLLVTNGGSGNPGSISVFSVAGDGTLTPVTGSPFTPDTFTPNQVVAF